MPLQVKFLVMLVGRGEGTVARGDRVVRAGLEPDIVRRIRVAQLDGGAVEKAVNVLG